MGRVIPPSNGTSLQNAMHKTLSDRRASSSLRALTNTPSGTVDFSSNDFLSLSTSAIFKAAFHQELTSQPHQPIGSRGSRLLDGNSSYAEDLEASIAKFHGAEAGLLFNSGFDANSGFFACVPQKGDVIVYDEYIHASVHEGMRLSRARSSILFKHNDVKALGEILKTLVRKDIEISEGRRNVFVAVEALYSMDGDLAPLKEIADVVQDILGKGRNGHLVVDEAHSTGVYGESGRGVVCGLGLEDQIFARLHTFGKAMGCNGAIILCNHLTRRYLINYARPLIYSTFMSFPTIAAIKASYTLMPTTAVESSRKHLFNLISHLHASLLSLHRSSLLSIPLEKPQSPIFALLTPEPRNLAKWCQDGGFMVRPIVSPTVPVGTERVRVCLHAGNTVEQVDRLVSRIRYWVERQGNVGSEVPKASSEVTSRL